MPPADRLRIALLTYSTQPRGGVVHACALAEALTELGHDVVLFALDDADRDFARPPRCAYRRIAVEPMRESIGAFVRRRIAAYVAYFSDEHARVDGPNERAFDIYHAGDGISANALATLVERGVIASFVRTVHHIDDFADAELAALQDRSIVRAARCYVVSNLWRAKLNERYGTDAAIVPNGVDLRRFAPVSPAKRIALRRKLGFGSGPVFVTIGGIEARKNTLRLLEAFALARAARPDARLIVAGGASVFEHDAYGRGCAARRAELGLGDDAVVVAGVRTDAEIVALLRAADAFVFPSLVEGFGLVVLEALACGTPVVTSALAPFNEYLPKDAALFVDPRDPSALATGMLRALQPHVRRRLRANGLNVVRTFTWEASARAHIGHYRAPYETAV